LTEAWLKNPKKQEYFIRTWLSVEEKWTNTFFKLEYDIKVATNNGVESQNKLLKSFYLKLLSDKSLNSILNNIISDKTVVCAKMVQSVCIITIPKRVFYCFIL